MSESRLTFFLAGFGKDGGYWICLRKGILSKWERQLMAEADAIVTYSEMCGVLDIRDGGAVIKHQSRAADILLTHLHVHHSCGKDLSILVTDLLTCHISRF